MHKAATSRRRKKTDNNLFLLSVNVVETLCVAEAAAKLPAAGRGCRGSGCGAAGASVSLATVSVAQLRP